MDLERYMHNNFAMMIGGLILTFVFVWGRGVNKKSWGNLREFWSDQNDEIFVALVFGMAFIIWDDQLLNAFNDVLVAIGSWLKMGVLTDLKDNPMVMSEHYYFLVAPAIAAIHFLLKKVNGEPK